MVKLSVLDFAETYLLFVSRVAEEGVGGDCGEGGPPGRVRVPTEGPRRLGGSRHSHVPGCRGRGRPVGHSLVSRLRSLGDRVTERLKGALRLGVQKALGVISTHYLVNFEQLAMGYIVPNGDDDAKVDAMEQADAGADGVASALAELFKGDLLPGAADDEDEGERDGEGDS